MVENLTDKVFKDLNGLTKDVKYSLCQARFDEENCATTSQLDSSHDAFSQRLDLFNENLAARLISFKLTSIQRLILYPPR